MFFLFEIYFNTFNIFCNRVLICNKDIMHLFEYSQIVKELQLKDNTPSKSKNELLF
jgi:hypothetical protein